MSFAHGLEDHGFEELRVKDSVFFCKDMSALNALKLSHRLMGYLSDTISASIGGSEKDIDISLAINSFLSKCGEDDFEKFISDVLNYSSCLNAKKQKVSIEHFSSKEIPVMLELVFLLCKENLQGFMNDLLERIGKLNPQGQEQVSK